GPGQDVGARLGRVVAVQDLPRRARHHYEPRLGQLGQRLGEVGRIRVVVPVQRALEPERVRGLLLRIVDRDHPDPRPRIVLALHRLPDPGAAPDPGDAIARRLRAWRLPVRAGDRPRGRRREHLAPVRDRGEAAVPGAVRDDPRAGVAGPAERVRRAVQFGEWGRPDTGGRV